MSHIEQECHESLIQGTIHSQQNSNKGLEYLPKLSFRELHDSKLSGLPTFDNMAIFIIWPSLNKLKIESWALSS